MIPTTVHSLPPLRAAGEIARALGSEGHGRVAVSGAWGAGKTLLATQTAEALGRPLLLITPGRIEAEAVQEDLASFAGEERCALLPAWEVLPTDAMDPSDDIVAERLHTLNALAGALDTGETLHVVAPVRAMMQAVVARAQLAADRVVLQVGEEHDLEDLVARLSRLGYDRDLMIEQRGQMSVRGGILDVFPISSELPYRIEFFGDEIESVRRFEPETQRSIDRADRVEILPRSEKNLLLEGAAVSVLDYFPPGTLVVFDEPLTCREEAGRLTDQFPDSPHMLAWQAIEEALAPHPQLSIAQMPHETPPGTERIRVRMSGLSGWQRDFDAFWKQLEEWNLEHFRVRIFCNNAGEKRRLLEMFTERGYRLDQDDFDLAIAIGGLRQGFLSLEDACAVFSEREIFGRHYVRRKRRRFEAGEGITSFGDLKSGDYIVHEKHGIGRYIGIRRFEGKAGDFLAIQYTKGDTLYLPVTHIDAIQRFVGGDGVVPKMDRLGGATWAKSKARAKKRIKDMTDQLVKLYAQRASVDGHAFMPDTPWQTAFEDEFPYDETPDQQRAIDDTKRDMEGAQPMDRLVCGDVGFGKTEVALRAAFKAVMDGKQVAFLVPTTILAEQHYNTFRERLADYPVRIEMLSRFRTAKQSRETVERISSGEVDVVVGTHRLVSKDIRFKNLGLLIIDEEQRFGVAQKEKLKEMRMGVDVLTMSATPIPRTLNMAFLGVRDMSLINTAPNDRLPVHTCVETWDERLVQEAIQRELARQGQVYFVHNRVHNIEPYAELVRELVPSARVAIAHGQMPERQLEEVMTKFIHHEIDVLVATTIVSSGLDIPNANTIIINNADHFGLAELYQMRGRVGRYKHRAFAYLLVPGDRALTEESQLRLKALEEFSTLGSGFRIAMRDLEIRGAGNLLGGEQHGVIESIGFETYQQLIQEAVAELKGDDIRPRVLPPFDISVDAHFPETYVPSEAQRITLYRRVAGVGSVDEVDEMHEELTDRFGRPPGPVKRLLDVMRVRALGYEAGVARILAGKRATAVEFHTARLFDRRLKAELEERFGERVSFAFKEKPSIGLAAQSEDAPALIRAAQDLLNALLEM